MKKQAFKSKTKRIQELLSKSPDASHSQAEKLLGFTMAHSTFSVAKADFLRSLRKSGGLSKKAVAAKGLEPNSGEVEVSDAESSFDGFFGAPIKGLPKQAKQESAVASRTPVVGKRSPVKFSARSLLHTYRLPEDLDSDTVDTLVLVLQFVEEATGCAVSLARVLPDDLLEVRVASPERG